nr:magnesium transporter [uncultured Cellulosilyticum sp.]
MNRERILELLAGKNFAALKEALAHANSVDLAVLLEEVEEKELLLVFRLLGKEEAAETFSYMSSNLQQMIIQGFTDNELKEVLDELFLDDTVDIIEEMPANVVKRILKNTDEMTRNMINVMLNYPKDSAGSIMTIEYVNLKKDMTVKEAITHIRKEGIDKETIYTCYVTENRKLIGFITVKDLLMANDEAKVVDIMETDVIYTYTHDDKEDVARMFGKYDFMAIPVVDYEKCLVGIVTVDDAMDVMEDEATEDMEKMAAMSPSEDSYFETSVFDHAKHRILWLLLLMLSATITGTIITRYEDAFSAIPLLVAFIPMLMDTGGNCGSQSSTLIIRGLALEEINFKDFFKVIFKEFRIALIVSVVLAVVNGIRILLMYKNLVLALVVGCSLVCTIIIAKVVGCILPLIAKKCKLDPAIMAAPLITTIVDTFSVLVYFNIATMFFKL